jgi:acetyltransferase-like isoleucine patch superfamily enzyme
MDNPPLQTIGDSPDIAAIASDSSRSRQSRRQRFDRVVTVLLKGVPFSIGMKLRNLVYRNVFVKLGTAVQIEPDVDFVRTYLISIGDRVQICSYAYLEASTETSQLKIGDRVRLDRGVDIRAHEHGCVEIGDRTRIGPYACLSGRQIKIGKDCLIASHAGIYANNHVFADRDRTINQQGREYQGIVIEDDCWLGSGVRVVDGVTIGQGSVIGAGAVVTKNIPAYSIAVGTPAKVIAQRGKDNPAITAELQ